MYGIPVFRRTLGIEVKLTQLGNGAAFKFPDNQIIRGDGVLVHGINCFSSSQLTISPAGNNIVIAAGLTGLVLSLQDESTANRVYQHPAFDFNSAQNNGLIREFKPFRLVLQNSYVTIVDITNLTVNYSLYFVILYTKLEDRT